MSMIKFIWDFRGPGALHTAKHHEVHLKEFCSLEKMHEVKTGFEVMNDLHAIAYLITADNHLALIRDRLRPHRAVKT